MAHRADHEEPYRAPVVGRFRHAKLSYPRRMFRWLREKWRRA